MKKGCIENKDEFGQNLGIEVKRRGSLGLAMREAARRLSLTVIVFWLSVVSVFSCTKCLVIKVKVCCIFSMLSSRGLKFVGKVKCWVFKLS